MKMWIVIIGIVMGPLANAENGDLITELHEQETAKKIFNAGQSLANFNKEVPYLGQKAQLTYEHREIKTNKNPSCSNSRVYCHKLIKTDQGLIAFQTAKDGIASVTQLTVGYTFCRVWTKLDLP